MKLRDYLGMFVISVGALSVGLSVVFFFHGELEKAQVLVLYAILSCLMISEQ